MNRTRTEINMSNAFICYWHKAMKTLMKNKAGFSHRTLYIKCMVSVSCVIGFHIETVQGTVLCIVSFHIGYCMVTVWEPFPFYSFNWEQNELWKLRETPQV